MFNLIYKCEDVFLHYLAIKFKFLSFNFNYIIQDFKFDERDFFFFKLNWHTNLDIRIEYDYYDLRIRM